jgi:3-dehydroquinate dehydratase/shikimate dehydrogenase
MDSPQKPRICISVCESTVAALATAVSAATAISDLIEVRLDCLAPAELAAGAHAITKILQDAGGDSILTFRPAEQGGRRALDDETRRAFWSAAIFSDSFFDVELDLAENFAAVGSPFPLPIDWSRTICSQHDFSGVPRNLEQLYDRLAATPARVLKIAFQANDALDCLPAFHLLDHARQEGREIIALAMGPAGLATRVLGPSRGAFLTYAPLNAAAATAPGQVSAEELRAVYRLEAIDRETQIFGLLGMPVSHSVSPDMHNAAFARADTNAVFIPFEVRDVAAFLKRMVQPATREINWNARGFSVTAPHKFTVMSQLDWIAPNAREIGAVNTIVVEGDELHGHNTDAEGFQAPLAQRLGDLGRASCAVIGAGGAASAAVWALRQAGAEVKLFVRNAASGLALAERFDVAWSELTNASLAGFDVVVNATPLGTAGEREAETPATARQLRGARLAYDLVYNPLETKFLREARAAGCETLGGLAMLVAQGEAQFRLWTGAAAPAAVMRAAAERKLAQR